MGIDKKYALLDTDFLYKTHLARNAKNHTLADIVIGFQDYEFFCHEMVREELTRHTIIPDPNPWFEDKVRNGRVKLYSDRDIVTELAKTYGSSATYMYLTLLETSCNVFDKGFFEEYYGSMNKENNLEDTDGFLAKLKTCDEAIPSQKGLGEKKTYVLIQMMQIMHSNRVYVFCSDDFKARQSISGLLTPIHCISILGVFRKLMKMGYEKSEVQEYYDKLSLFLKNQTTYRVWNASGHQRVKVPVQQVLDDIYNNKFQLLRNGDLQYIKEMDD